MIYAAVLNAAALSTAHRAEQFVQHGRRYGRADPRYAAWLTSIRLQVRRPAHWPLDALYAVTIVLHPLDRVGRDADNVCKPLLDALQWPRVGRRRAIAPHASTLWRDDSQVRDARIVIGAPVDEPRVVLVAHVVTAEQVAERALELIPEALQQSC